MSATEISTPLPVTTSTTAMGALTGLTGYMTLGLGAKALKPAVVTVNESETLIAKDSEDDITYTMSTTYSIRRGTFHRRQLEDVPDWHH
jgi:hypothetical protein